MAQQLNIPNAKKIYDLQHSKEIDREQQLVAKQQKIIEDTFAEDFSEYNDVDNF